MKITLQRVSYYLLVALQIVLLLVLIISINKYNKRHRETKTIYCKLFYSTDDEDTTALYNKYCEEGTSYVQTDDTLEDKKVEIKLCESNEYYWKHAVSYLVIANTLVFLSLSTLYKGFGNVASNRVSSG
mgnify:CR=1 FL=1